MKRLGVLLVTLIAAFGLVVPTANAAPKAPKPSVTTSTEATYRVDKQTPPPTIVINGVSNKTPITVKWDDATIQRQTGRCNVTKAKRNPTSCALTFSNTYSTVGDKVITVAVRGDVLFTQTVAITPAPTQWTPPAGWVQPAGWSYLSGGATYLPCSTIKWHWSRDNEPADRSNMKNLMPTVVSILSQETGLTFEETENPTEANLTFKWTDLPNYPNAAGTGGGNPRTQTGQVELNKNNWWTLNSWNGFGIVTQPDGMYSNGNGWLLVHEIMHTLGLGHVDDATEIMNPILIVSELGEGDKDGLRTMYLNQPCYL